MTLRRSSTGKLLKTCDGDLQRQCCCGAPSNLLLHFNGTDAATTTVDDSCTGHTVTAVGDVQLDTAQKKFGTASSLFDGTDDRWTVPNDVDWRFAANFTVECFFRPRISHLGILLNYGDVGAPAPPQWELFIDSDDSIGCDFSISASETTSITGGTVNIGSFNHAVMHRTGSTVTLGLNGLNIGTGTVNGAFPDASTVLLIGARLSNASIEREFDGHIDEVRILSDTADGSVPTAEYPNCFCP